MNQRLASFARVLVALSIVSAGLAVPNATSALAGPSAKDNALARMRADAGGKLVVRAHPDGRPSFIEGDIPVKKFSSQSSASARANDFWKAYGAALGVSDAASQLHLLKTRSDKVGTTLKFEQRYKGLTVLGRQLDLNFRGNSVTSVNGDFAMGINVPTSPSISSSQAAAAGRAYYARSSSRSTHATPALLVYVDGTQHAHLAWKVVTATSRPFGVWTTMVDARTGKVLWTYSAIHAALARNVYTNGNDLDCFSNPQTVDDGACNLPGTADRLDGAGPVGDADANNVYDTATSVYNFYNTNFSGRDSYNATGGALNGTVHFGSGFINSFWCNTDCLSTFTTATAGEQAVFGDGTDSNFNSFGQDPDVVAHEFSHGYNEYSVGGGGFLYVGQSGALDESYADTFAWLINGSPQLGSTSWHGGGGDWLRNLADPSTDNPAPDPSTMSGYVSTVYDSGGVHTNSLIPSHAAYLLSQDAAIGGTTKAEQIIYRAINNYLTPTSTFQDNAAALYLAARDLYGAGSDESKAVITAEAAVGIALPPAISAPTSGLTFKGSTPTTVSWSGVGVEGRQFSVDYATTSGSPVYTQGFEGTTLPGGFTSADTPWVSTTSDFWSGSRAVKAGTITNNGRSALNLQRTLTAPGTLSFWYRVSSEDGFDFFSFYIDGNLAYLDTGQPAGWIHASGPIAAGTHTFTWLYQKDEIDTGPVGSDTVWLDDLSITNSPTFSAWTTIGSNPTATDAHSTPWTTPAVSSASYRVRVRVFGMGPGMGESITGPFTVDASPPTGQNISSSLALWQTTVSGASGGTAKYTVSWSASDALTGIQNYDVRWRYAFPITGAYVAYSLIEDRTIATSQPLTFTGSEGSTTCFGVLARDGVGNTSAYSADRCTAVPISTSHLSRSSGWGTGSSSAYYEGVFIQSTHLGSYLLSRTLKAKRVALIAYKCATCGIVEVYRGSTLLARINLYSKTTVVKALITVHTYTSVQAAAAFKIRVYSSGKLVRVEGLGLSLY